MTKQPTTKYAENEILILFIGIIVICYSTYQTARGFEANTGGLFQAWVWAILIGLSLSYLALELRKKLLQGNKPGALLMTFFYLFVATFSFIANFNTFYSGATKSETLNNQIDLLSNKLSTLKSQSYSYIDKVPEAVGKLQITLEKQILDPALPDWGPETQKIIDELSRILGVPITKPSGKPIQKLTSVKIQIDELLRTHTAKTDTFKQRVNSDLDRIMQQFKSVKKEPNSASNIEIINEAKKTYNSICSDAIAFLPKDFQCSQLAGFNDEEIGQIQYTLKSALDNPMNALIPALQSALLDLVLPFMIFASTISKRTQKTTPQFPKR